MWQSEDNSAIVHEHVHHCISVGTDGERIYVCNHCGKPSDLLSDGYALRLWFGSHALTCSQTDPGEEKNEES